MALDALGAFARSLPPVPNWRYDDYDQQSWEKIKPELCANCRDDFGQANYNERRERAADSSHSIGAPETSRFVVDARPAQLASRCWRKAQELAHFSPVPS